MKEEYLHHLWQQKRLPFHHLKSVDGEELEVINTGWLNPDSGPDFFSGSVLIDGIKWSGNIELHIHSSDWYKHNHHKDPAYNNVVLHVVLKHDKDVFINDRKLPTVELIDFIDQSHLNRYESILNQKNSRPCHNILKESDLINEQLENSLFQRLARKTNEIKELKQKFKLTNKASFQLFMAQAFGGRANKDAFRELSLKLNLKMILKEYWSIKNIEALVFGVAGFLEDQIALDSHHNELKKEWHHLKRKYDLTAMNKSAWKFSGMRPPSFPTIKLSQYARYLANAKFDFQEKENPSKTLKKFKEDLVILPHDYWSLHYDFGKKWDKPIYNLSSQFKNQLAINGLAPFLFFLGQLKNDFNYIDLAFGVLEKIPSENNYIIKQWKEEGIIPKNANESQALIELNNEFCTFRRCLSCRIGQQLLNKE